MRTALITIGMPVFNAESTISASIQSVVNQSHKNWKLLISDNSSTDQTSKICEAFARLDSRIIFHKQSENVGAWPNFWYVLNDEPSKYFKFLASDDCITSRFLEECIDILECDSTVVGVTADDLYESDQAFKSNANSFDFMNDRDNRFINFLQNAWVSNGVFYGVFRTDSLRGAFSGIEQKDFLIKDWLIIARLLFEGKIARVHSSEIILGESGFGRNPTNWKKQLNSFSDWILPYRYFSKGILKQSRQLKIATRIKLGIFLLNLYFNHYKGMLRTSLPFWKIG